MNVKHEQIDSKNPFYFFVDFSSGVSTVPTILIVPAAIVATAVRICHELFSLLLPCSLARLLFDNGGGFSPPFPFSPAFVDGIL